MSSRMFFGPLFMGLIIFSSNPLFANNDTYIGINLTSLDYSEKGLNEELSLRLINGRLGSYFSDYLSGEVRLGLGIGGDSIELMGFDVDVDLDDFIGVYLRGGIPVADAFYPYVVVGYARSTLSLSVNGPGQISDSETDTSLGFGADILLVDNVILNIEYMNFFDKGVVEIDGISLGLATRF